MSLTRWMTAAMLFLALSGGGVVLSAQQGRGGPGLGVYGLGPRLGENVELALSLQNELGLSAEQVASLNAVQAGISRDVEPVATEIANLRAGLIAGEVDRLSGINPLQELFAQYEVAAAPYRIQVESILTPAQHESLQIAMWQTRPVPGTGLYGPVGGLDWDYGLRPRFNPGVGFAGPRGLGAGWGPGFGRGAGRGLGRGLGRGRGLRWWR